MAVILHLVAGTPRGGLWCPHCLLPSGIEVPLCTIGDRGVSLIAHYRFCNDCRTPLRGGQ